MKLYVRYKKDGKWTWRPATGQDILNAHKLNERGAEIHTEVTRKLVDGDGDNAS